MRTTRIFLLSSNLKSKVYKKVKNMKLFHQAVTALQFVITSSKESIKLLFMLLFFFFFSWSFCVSNYPLEKLGRILPQVQVMKSKVVHACLLIFTAH